MAYDPHTYEPPGRNYYDPNAARHEPYGQQRGGHAMSNGYGQAQYSAQYDGQYNAQFDNGRGYASQSTNRSYNQPGHYGYVNGQPDPYQQAPISQYTQPPIQQQRRPPPPQNARPQQSRPMQSAGPQQNQAEYHSRGPQSQPRAQDNRLPRQEVYQQQQFANSMPQQAHYPDARLRPDDPRRPRAPGQGDPETRSRQRTQQSHHQPPLERSTSDNQLDQGRSKSRAPSRNRSPRKPLIEVPDDLPLAQDNAFPLFPTKQVVAKQMKDNHSSNGDSRPNSSHIEKAKPMSSDFHARSNGNLEISPPRDQANRRLKVASEEAHRPPIDPRAPSAPTSDRVPATNYDRPVQALGRPSQDDHRRDITVVHRPQQQEREMRHPPMPGHGTSPPRGQQHQFSQPGNSPPRNSPYPGPEMSYHQAGQPPIQQINTQGAANLGPRDPPQTFSSTVLAHRPAPAFQASPQIPMSPATVYEEAPPPSRHYQQHQASNHAKSNSLSEMYAEYYGEDLNHQHQNGYNRDDEIEAEMPNFDNLDSAQPSNHKRGLTLDAHLNNAPPISKAPPMPASPNGGFYQQGQQAVSQPALPRQHQADHNGFGQFDFGVTQNNDFNSPASHSVPASPQHWNAPGGVDFPPSGQSRFPPGHPQNPQPGSMSNGPAPQRRPMGPPDQYPPQQGRDPPVNGMQYPPQGRGQMPPDQRRPRPNGAQYAPNGSMPPPQGRMQAPNGAPNSFQQGRGPPMNNDYQARPEVDRIDSAQAMRSDQASKYRGQNGMMPPPPQGDLRRSPPSTLEPLVSSAPGGRMPPSSDNPDALPHHAVPVRPGLSNQSPISQNAMANQPPRPAPLRQYGTPVQQSQQSQPAPSPRSSIDTRRQSQSQPVTQGEISRLQAEVNAHPQDHATALLLAKKLIEAATVLASENGRLDPRQTAKNREKYIMDAHRRIKKLVTHGYPDAQFYMADCYGQGLLGLEVDTKEAFNLYQAAAKGGHAQAAYRTAVCCEMGPEEGGGTRRDYQKAFQWYRRAAQLQDVAAMFKLGMILLKGLLGQQRNIGEAEIWLKRAAERADKDNPHALHELGLMYEPDNTDPAIKSKIIPDEQYSRELFMKAAKLGYKQSQCRLGQAYEYGSLGLPIDARSSIAWYSKAAAQGEHNAELALSGW